MKSVVVIQCLLYSCSDSGAELAVKLNRDTPQIASNLGVWIPAIPVGLHIGKDSLYDSQDIISSFQSRGLFLGAQAPAITTKTRNERGQNPTSNHPQGILWNLKCAGWCLRNHLWLYPVSWLLSFFVCNLFGRMAPTPTNQSHPHRAGKPTWKAERNQMKSKNHSRLKGLPGAVVQRLSISHSSASSAAARSRAMRDALCGSESAKSARPRCITFFNSSL